MERSAQEIFDTVAKHLLTQNARSVGSYFETGGCRYRGPNGLKCAVGCLIPDELYDPEMEGHGSTFLVMNYPELGFHGVSRLLSHLQSIHDHDDVKWWPEGLRSLAAEFGLSDAVVDAAVTP